MNKKNLFFTILYFLLSTALLSTTIVAQNLGGCASDEVINTSYSAGSLDGYTSPAWHKYKKPDSWIPNSNIPIKTIKINYIICRKDDGSGGWIDNSEFRSEVDLMIDKINENFSNIPIKGYSVECEPNISYITDSRIRFELNEIIFIDNTDLHYLDLFDADPIIDYLDVHYPDHVNAMNHIFTMPPEDEQGWGNAWGNYNNYNDHLYIHTRNSMWSDDNFYWIDHEEHFKHEYGHALGFQHTYDSEYTDISHYDFLDDVFGTCADPDYCNPMPNTGHVCHLDKDYFTPQPSPYPIMCGAGPNSYISPKQTGRMHRDLMFYDYIFKTLNNPMHKYVKEKYSYTAPFKITENETWDFHLKMYQDIIIEPGNILNVTGTIKMPIDGKIIVKPGAELIVDGGKITSAHDEQWQGIEVWGTRSESQMPCTTTGMTCNQGYLELNDAVIENAKVAVELWNPDHWGQTGGIVVAEGATFRNNAKSVHATHYQNFNLYDPTSEMPDVSRFIDCTFEINGDYLGTEKFYKHVDLAQVYGFEFIGCDFSVDASANNVSEFNSAIASYDAGFRVEERCLSSTQPCADMDKSTFRGFYDAVNANSSDIMSYTFHVHNAVFENNTYGISSTNVDNSTILFNDFFIGPNNTRDKQCCSSTPGTGIFMDNSSGFAIEENYFTKADGAPTGEYTGIHIKDAESVDEVYKNDFEGLSYANLAEGKNWKDQMYTGLTYYCNENMQNYADFYVSSVISNPENSIQLNQGNDYEVTGNTFSQSGATWHFYNGGIAQIGYYYCATCPDENPDDDKIYHVTDKAKNLTPDCQSHYGDPVRSVSLTAEQTDEAEQDYFTAYNDFSNVETLYNNLKDGGSTPAELQAVESAQPSDMWELRSQLLGDSPHLSMDVLKKTADRTDVFSDQALFDILSANPDELKKDELMKYLEEKEDPLPDYMIEILKEVAEGTTYKTVLQNQMAEHSRKKARAAKDIIRSLLNEENPDMNELRNWLDNLGGLNADRQIISTYLHVGNYTDALALADLLPGLYGLEGEALQAHNDYVSLLNLYKTLDDQDRNTYQLTEDEVKDLEIIAEGSKGKAAAQAKSILESAYGQHFYSCTNLEGNPADKSQGINMEDMAQLKQVSVTVQPNPAKDWATFEYQLSYEESQGVITIVNTEGKVVKTLRLQGKQGQKLVDTRSMKPGGYFYTFKTEGVVQAGKLIITK